MLPRLLGIFILLSGCCWCVCVCIGSGGKDVPSLNSREGVERWDHNYSCIFDSYKTFTYLHIGYVPYFNISGKTPTYATTDECLDACTADCSCSAVVYDVPRDSCYHYHDLIAIQSIQLNPVTSHDTVSAYIKVQRGFGTTPGGYYNSAAPHQFINNSSLMVLLLLVATGALILW